MLSTRWRWINLFFYLEIKGVKMFAKLIHKVKNLFFIPPSFAAMILFSGGMPEQLVAGEKIIQQEKMSFERCLKVISVSEDKLLVAADISDIAVNKRAAIFSLTDGTLTITCDGDKSQIIVTTHQE